MAATSGERATSPPSGIVPRWEWRTFGAGFDDVDAVLSPRSPSRVGSSDETYLLSLHSDASVKVRDGLMDVKHLLRIDEHGLELWTPVLKASFPVTRDQAATVLATLGAPEPTDDAPSYSLDELLGQLIGSRPDLLAVQVRKGRTHYDIDGCSVESTLFTVDGATSRSITVESPDPSVVAATVARLGLSERRNVSVARGLKALVGFGTRRYSVVDVGTNSVKFHMGERHADGSTHTIVDRADTTRLGEGQDDSGVLADAAIARTVEAIAAMADEARGAGVDEIVAVGTAGLRRAPNRSALVDAVQARSAVTVEVISGEEEARLAYLAATSALPAVRGQVVVFDSGGGSTQFTFGRDALIDDRFSLDIGAVRVAERFGLASAVSTDTLDEVLEALAAELARLDDRPRPDAVVAIGGTSTNLAAVNHGLGRYDPDVVHGTVIDTAELDRQIELYRTRDADGRRRIAGLQPPRAEVILAGACIVRTIFTKLRHDSMTVSDRGLRHGVVIGRMSGPPPG